MRTRDELYRLGMAKLADATPGESAYAAPDWEDMPQLYRSETPEPTTAPKPTMTDKAKQLVHTSLNDAAIGTFRAPTPAEHHSWNNYARSATVGGLSGAALATLLAVLTKQKVLPHLGIGASTGLLAGTVRQFDQDSDPPGLSPVYTIPAGLRLGALVGGVAGLPLGHLTGAGILPGLLSGAAAGAIAGGSASSFI